MKLFDKYFQPYAEYCIRTTLSEDELKAVLKKECPATGDILSLKAFKAVIGLGKTVIFSCNPDDPLHLTPLKFPRNSSRGDLFIQCENAANGETILHISLGPNGKYKYLAYAICVFASGWGIAASFIIRWGIFLPVLFIGLFFIVLECCRAAGIDEVPQIRQDFEMMLRTLERKSHYTENIPQENYE